MIHTIEGHVSPEHQNLYSKYVSNLRQVFIDIEGITEETLDHIIQTGSNILFLELGSMDYEGSTIYIPRGLADLIDFSTIDEINFISLGINTVDIWGQNYRRRSMKAGVQINLIERYCIKIGSQSKMPILSEFMEGIVLLPQMIASQEGCTVRYI